jgi:uncharacterized protein
MGLIRLLTYIVLIWLAIQLYKRLTRPSTNSRRKPKAKPVQTFVACDICGLHVPREEAIEHAGRYYCSVDHRDNGQT